MVPEALTCRDDEKTEIISSDHEMVRDRQGMMPELFTVWEDSKKSPLHRDEAGFALPVSLT
jgi:hypothetical protein